MERDIYNKYIVCKLYVLKAFLKVFAILSDVKICKTSLISSLNYLHAVFTLFL